MSKIHALITTIVVGLSSTAMAAPGVSFQAKADARIDVRLPAVRIPAVTVQSNFDGNVHDHRVQQTRFEQTRFEQDRFEQPRGGWFHDAAYTLNVSGTYSSNYGTVVLKQRGNRIFGSYVTLEGSYHGTIDGTIKDGMITYRFVQPGQQGAGIWYLNNRTGRLEGTWGTNGSLRNGGNWTLFAK